MRKKLGIIIVNYNDYEMTSRLINNIKYYNCLNKIVIVDNNSSDDSYQKLNKTKNDKISVIKNDNRSYSSGLNLGAKYLINEIGDCNIIFSNSDIIIKNEKDIINLANNIHDEVVAVGPTIEECGQLNRGWHLPNVNQEILFNLPLISRYFKKKYLNYKKEEYNEDTTVVDVVSGCFFIVDSSYLVDSNYFDENTFLYYEEQIFAKKVKDNHKKILVDNKVTIIHDHSVSIDKSVKRINKHKITKKSQRYYAKEYLKANIIQMALLYITDYFYRIILYIRCIIGR